MTAAHCRGCTIYVRIVLIAAVVLFAIVAAAYFIPGVDSIPGTSHDQFRSMQQAGEPAGAALAWLGWLFLAIGVTLIFAMLSLGVVRGKSFRGAGWPMSAVYVATLAVWTAIVVTSVGYTSNPDQSFLLGWPLPTGLVIFVFLPVMFLINVVFVVVFPRSILTEEDLQQFEQAELGEAAREQD